MIHLFFSIDQFETDKKKYVHFLKDGMSVSVQETTEVARFF
jgi:hypothetical protein